jgi:hypothetical protein
VAPRVCPGCPVEAGVADRDRRFPACELCRWPAVNVGAVHAWRCVACRHWNEHGDRRPRVAAVALRLGHIGGVARGLPAVVLAYGYLADRGEVWRDVLGSRQDTALRGFVESSCLLATGLPCYVRGQCAGHEVLLVGGDKANPYPLGAAEVLRCKPRSWATRVSCTCAASAPCIHAQALYALAVGAIVARPEDGAPAREEVAA